MMVSEIIRMIEDAGCEPELVKGRLNIKRGKKLEPSLLELIRDNKPEIVSVLLQDKQAEAVGFVTGLHGTVYMQTIGKRTIVYIENMGDKWELRKETYADGRKPANYTKTLANGTFQEVLSRAESYFNYLKGMSA